MAQYSPDMNLIEHCLDRIGRNVNKRNEVVTLEDLACALVDEWNNLELQFLIKLVQCMPRRVHEPNSVEMDTSIIDIDF